MPLLMNPNETLQGMSGNHLCNRSLTVAAPQRLQSRDRKGAVFAKWNSYFLTGT